MRGRRRMTVGLVLAATLGVVGCAPTTDAERAPSPSPTASPTATADTDAEIAAAEEQLPIPVDDIPAWAETVVPGPDTDGHVGSLSGWLSDASSAHYTSRYESLEPGGYQAQIACRGGGTISISGGDLDAGLAPEPTVCTNETIAFDVATTGTGVEVVLDLAGAPTIFAVSLLRVS